MENWFVLYQYNEDLYKVMFYINKCSLICMYSVGEALKPYHSHPEDVQGPIKAEKLIIISMDG